MAGKEKIVRGIFRKLRNANAIDRIMRRLSTMYLEESSHFSYDQTLNGEDDIIKALGVILPQDEHAVFFDVGANVGDWTAHMDSVFQKYETHLFEVSPSTFETLKTRFADDIKFKLNNTALSNKNGEIEFVDFGKDYGGNTLLLNSNYHKKDFSLTKAKAITGDDYIAQHSIERVNFLKIDTEGAEYFVLDGFKNALKEQKIDMVQFEYGYTHADAKTLMKDFFELFEAHGYIVGKLRKDGVHFKTFEYSDNDFKSGPNYVACLPKWREVLSRF